VILPVGHEITLSPAADVEQGTTGARGCRQRTGLRGRMGGAMGTGRGHGVRCTGAARGTCSVLAGCPWGHVQWWSWRMDIVAICPAPGAKNGHVPRGGREEWACPEGEAVKNGHVPRGRL
jgi:hypothetical protein